MGEAAGGVAGAWGQVAGWRGRQAHLADATLCCAPHFQQVFLVEMTCHYLTDAVKLSNGLDHLAVVSHRDQWECLAGQSNVDI